MGKTITWTTTQVVTRRSLLGGIGAVLAAPAIVRAASLMPVKAWDDDPLRLGGFEIYADKATNSWWVPQQRYPWPVSGDQMRASLRKMLERESAQAPSLYVVNPRMLNLLEE